MPYYQDMNNAANNNDFGSKVHVDTRGMLVTFPRDFTNEQVLHFIPLGYKVMWAYTAECYGLYSAPLKRG